MARNHERLEEVVAALRAAGHEAEGLALDVQDQAATRRALAGWRFDILVNNAGTNRPKPIDQVTEEDYAAVMELNVRATYFLTQTVIEEIPAGGERDQHLLADGARGRQEPQPLLRLESRSGRHDPRHGGRTGASRHSRQQPLPNLHRNPDDAALLPGTRLP